LTALIGWWENTAGIFLGSVIILALPIEILRLILVLYIQKKPSKDEFMKARYENGSLVGFDLLRVLFAIFLFFWIPLFSIWTLDYIQRKNYLDGLPVFIIGILPILLIWRSKILSLLLSLVRAKLKAILVIYLFTLFLACLYVPWKAELKVGRQVYQELTYDFIWAPPHSEDLSWYNTIDLERFLLEIGAITALTAMMVILCIDFKGFPRTK